MGSSRVFTVNATTMAIRSRIDLGSVGNGDFGQQMPRGVALKSTVGGAPQTAYVLNSFENTVSVVDVSNPDSIAETTQFAVGNDPTPAEVRRGRIAFNSGFASSNGSFSCGSCHPDGNTDQLMWRIGAECFLGGCVAGEDEPRSTMPIRGLKNTLPLHWAGNLGDPFGGGNGDVGFRRCGRHRLLARRRRRRPRLLRRPRARQPERRDVQPDALVRVGPSGAPGHADAAGTRRSRVLPRRGLVSAAALAPHRRHDLDRRPIR